MATFIEVRPVVSDNADLNRVTTFARIDNDDFYGTVRVELDDKDNPGTRLRRDYQFNFNGLEDGDQIRNEISRSPTDFTEVIEYVRVSKLENQERCRYRSKILSSAKRA